VGALTDTGFVTDEAVEALAGVDLLLLEANHDIPTLRAGSYPYYLKQRILGSRGHLCNEAAADFALYCAQHGTRDILLAHLSAENNTPDMAEYAVARRLQAAGVSVRLGVAPRDRLSEVHTVCRL
jgi:phosphoribosyl 1,2-cyclic phosphodiesterase